MLKLNTGTENVALGADDLMKWLFALPLKKLAWEIAPPVKVRPRLENWVFNAVSVLGVATSSAVPKTPSAPGKCSKSIEIGLAKAGVPANKSDASKSVRKRTGRNIKTPKSKNSMS